MCHVLEAWMKYDALCTVIWGWGLSKGYVSAWSDRIQRYAIQSWGVCDSCEDFYSLWHSIIHCAVHTHSQFHFGFTIRSWHEATLMTAIPNSI